MAERKAVNKYYPPEWTPSKGSINKFRGTHALRERARKLHMGILIIRFEMPFNIWCGGCNSHIGMGVRYNAEKSKVGMYYTTPIYKFRMKCHLCTNHFEIQTDPQNLDYVILNGARRQEGRWDPNENDQIAPEEKEVSKKLAVDPMFRLEHNVEDKVKQKTAAPSVAQLEELQERWKDDYVMNKVLRQKFRETKKALKIAEDKDRALLEKCSLDISLLPESAEDCKLAGLLKLTPLDTFEERQKSKREEIISRPLFSAQSSTNSTINSPLSKSVLAQKVAQTKRQAIVQPLTASQLGIVKKIEKDSNDKDHSGTTSDTANSKNTFGIEVPNNFTKNSLVEYDSDISD